MHIYMEMLKIENTNHVIFHFNMRKFYYFIILLFLLTESSLD